MIAPSGNGSFASRYALIATSLPSTAAKLLRLPSSWATEINVHSRYPGGIFVTKIGAACLSPCPDAGAVNANAPPSVAQVPSKRASHFIGLSIMKAQCDLRSRAKVTAAGGVSDDDRHRQTSSLRAQ